MKTLWSVVCVMALANLVAIAGFAGWLVATGRLDAQRLTEVRDALRETSAQRQAREQEEAAAAAAAAPAPEAPGPFPVRSDELLALRLQADAVDQQRLVRLRREIADLQAGLRRERAILDAERERLETERAQFAQQQARLEELRGSEQFKKSLVTLETVKAGEAKDILLAMLGVPPPDEPAGAEPDAAAPAPSYAPEDLERVVAYLDAMQDRTRAKVIAEVAKDNAPLAADLLERLRRHGLAARAPESPDG